MLSVIQQGFVAIYLFDELGFLNQFGMRLQDKHDMQNTTSNAHKESQEVFTFQKFNISFITNSSIYFGN